MRVGFGVESCFIVIVDDDDAKEDGRGGEWEMMWLMSFKFSDQLKLNSDAASVGKPDDPCFFSLTTDCISCHNCNSKY